MGFMVQLADGMCTDNLQESNARTGRRNTGVQPRPRVERRRQRNKHIVYEGGSRRSGLLGWVLHDGLGLAVGIVYSYEGLKKLLRMARYGNGTVGGV